jgi:hypothetical protein
MQSFRLKVLLPSAILSFGLLGETVGAQTSAKDQPESMTRIVVRLTGPHIKPGSIAAMPKTIYEAAPHFARIEDPPDARQRQQKLIVVAEPDAYSANLIDKTGTHVRDAGGDDRNDLHLPIVLPFDPKHRLGVLDGIEFGSEVDFFKQAGATKSAGPVINGKPTDAYDLKTPGGVAKLVTRGGSDVPVTLTWPADDGQYRYEYIEYTDQPFDLKLFTKPEGIRFRDVQPDNTREPG